VQFVPIAFEVCLQSRESLKYVLQLEFKSVADTFIVSDKMNYNKTKMTLGKTFNNLINKKKLLTFSFTKI
jgi:hypothetical protein